MKLDAAMICLGIAILTETITSERENENPGILDFLSVELRKRKRKKISGI